MRRIAIVNRKGGCGKTTTAISLAGHFARAGKRTLLVDMDPQSHCAAGLAIPESRLEMDVGDAMLSCERSSFDPSRLVWRVTRNLDLAPSRSKLAGMETNRRVEGDPSASWMLDTLLTRLGGGYDICVIDTPPSAGLLARNAVAAASTILMPVETSYFSLLGVRAQSAAIEATLGSLGLATPWAIVPTNHDDRVALAVDLLAELRRHHGEHIAPMVIPTDLRVKESASFGQPVTHYAPESPASTALGALGTWAEGLSSGQHRRAGRDAGGSESRQSLVSVPGRTAMAGACGTIEHAPSRAEDLAMRARMLRQRREVGVE